MQAGHVCQTLAEQESCAQAGTEEERLQSLLLVRLFVPTVHSTFKEKTEVAASCHILTSFEPGLCHIHFISVSEDNVLTLP